MNNNIARYAFIMSIFASFSYAQTSTNQTSGSNSPIQNCTQGQCSNTYNYNRAPMQEKIGKKIALHGVYMVPTYKISERFCDENNKHCGDLYESVFFYLDIQSIWPEPVLLTSAEITINKSSVLIKKGPHSFGSNSLEPQITKNNQPENFLIRPGEIKRIELSEGLKITGIMDFFKQDLGQDFIFEEACPITDSNLRRVSELNAFIKDRYGKDAEIFINLYEKDYQPALKAKISLAEGSDMFVEGNVTESKYKIQSDSFIGEVLYQLRGGNEDISYRCSNKK